MNVAELIDAVRQKDTAAWEQLCALCRNRLRQWAGTAFTAELGLDWDPSDVVQESMAEASRDFRNFRGREEEELLAWLRTIMEHTLIDRARHQSRQKRNGNGVRSLDAGPVAGQNLRAVLPDDASSVCQRVIREEQKGTLLITLQRLPDDQALAVRLRHLEGLSVEQISERMSRSGASVAGLLIRAMRRLRELMAEEVF